MNEADDCSDFLINHQSYTLYYRKINIPKQDPIEQLEHASLFPKAYWKHRESLSTYVALGSLVQLKDIPKVKRIGCRSGIKFDPFFLGGCSFNYPQAPSSNDESFQKTCFFLPQFLIEHQDEECILHHYSFEPIKDLSIPSSPTTFDSIYKKSEPLFRQDTPCYSNWIKLVENEKTHMNNSLFSKLVLARKTTLEYPEDINPFSLFSYLLSKNQNANHFLFSFKPGCYFLGASPECLFTRSNLHITSEALAGTCKSCEENFLLTSEKNELEFQYVSDYLNALFQKICTSHKKTAPKEVISGLLRHLNTSFEGFLNQPYDDAELIQAFHPTPAICGYPKQVALDKIKAVEPFQRGWYSAPLGLISESKSQWIVAIRSALIKKNTLSLFAGCGLIKESNPLEEWQELENKIALYLEYSLKYV